MVGRNSSTARDLQSTTSISFPNEYIPICGSYGSDFKSVTSSTYYKYLSNPAVTIVTNFVYPDLINVVYDNSLNKFSYTRNAYSVRYARMTSILNMTFNIPYLYFTKQKDEFILKSHYNTTVETIGITDGTNYISSILNESPTTIDLTKLVNLKTIRFFMFKNPKLKNVYLPNNLTSIGDSAFNECTNLASINLPDGLTTIGNNAFNSCDGLTELTFKGTPTSIEADTFSDCTNLTTINVPWSEGDIANAPWGATNATINYNYTA